MKTIPAEVVSEIETILEAGIADFKAGGWDHPAKDRDDQRNHHRYWDMLREVKGVDYNMASLPGYMIVPILQRVLQARGYDGLSSLGYDSEGEAIDDLECLWDTIKLAMDEAPLAAAIRMAKRHPLQFQTKRISPMYHFFLNVGYQLQLMRGDNYIALPVVVLGRMLGKSPMRISDYRGYAQNEDHHLKMVAKECWNGKGSGIATKFRFVGVPISINGN